MARGKSLTHYCAHCERIAKLELVGLAENQESKAWYRCTRCRHAVLLDLSDIRKKEEDSKKKLERSDCSEYDPHKSYAVGQAIFHTEWDDLGKIVSKEKTSGGASAIVVSFERLGERRLLENIIDRFENQE